MAISEKQQSFIKENIGKQEKASPPKEEEKDTSLFKGRPYVTQETGKRWVKGNEAYNLTKIPEKRRTEVWENITKGTDIHFQTSEAKEKYKEIKESSLVKVKEKYGIKSEGERKGMLKMLEKSLGKSLKK
ncbi:MAG TPA: hypothetical protein VMV66_00500 [Candidatus Humimicrobiaceae bacterium]|nr:hypothetical protein [Candidatus Humimicrobiaceae bacterium]